MVTQRRSNTNSINGGYNNVVSSPAWSSSLGEEGPTLPVVDEGSSSSSSSLKGGGSSDNKYSKRRKQNRMRNAVMLLVVALCCLAMTCKKLMNDSWSSSRAGKATGTVSGGRDRHHDRHRRRHHGRRRRTSGEGDDGDDDDKGSGSSNDDEEEGDDDKEENDDRDDRHSSRRHNLHNEHEQHHHERPQQEQQHHHHRGYPPHRGRGGILHADQQEAQQQHHGQVAEEEEERDDDENTEIDDDHLAAGPRTTTTRGKPKNVLNDYQQQQRRNKDIMDMDLLDRKLREFDEKIRTNTQSDIRWVDVDLLPSTTTTTSTIKKKLQTTRKDVNPVQRSRDQRFFVAHGRSKDQSLAWIEEDSKTNNNQQQQQQQQQHHGNITRTNYVDYVHHPYEYTPKMMEPPTELGEYPNLRTMKELMEIWPQDELDSPPNPIVEDLIHFDYNIKEDLEAATKFRDAKLPFKLVNVPEVVAAGQRWTDEYVSKNFDGTTSSNPQADGKCQESTDNFFAFYTPPAWSVELMGIPPTRNNDYSFAEWARHAHYADRVGLSPGQPHFYFQAGVDRKERYEDPESWTFISKDLPSFSSTEANFFQFEPESQKGIQCRFGERGVTAATHYDSGRNMVAMMTGAKRYILSPPKECPQLGIVTEPGNAIYRHSMLNFGHLNHMDRDDMPAEERKWLERASEAMAVSTVLKEGEVLFIPSHWFHYITSLQKSAQCNVRSGVDIDGDEVFGGAADVTHKCHAVVE